MSSQGLQQGAIVRGALLPETVEVLSVARFGASVKIVGRGLKTGLARDLVLTPEQVAQWRFPAPRRHSMAMRGSSA